ncbi:10631_t:CDS:2, partial [Dentiscutata heterogama]
RHFREDIMVITYLPASESYTELYRIYQSSLDETSDFNISRSSFNMRFNAQFWTESEQDQNVQQWNDHITWAHQEREYY